MRKRSLYWTLQLTGWGIFLLLSEITVFVDPIEQVQEEGQAYAAYVNNAIEAIVLFFVSHFVLRAIIVHRDWLTKQLGRVIPLLILTVAFCSLLGQAISTGIQSLLFNIDLSPSGLTANILFPSLTTLALYVIWTSVYFLYHYLESNNRSLKYEAAMNEMHLNQLKSQLNPHFIFNALNSMRALVDEEPKKAKTAITQLSNILRNSLITDKQRVVNFKDELDTVKDYLALEGIRFEERLQVEFNIAKGSEFFEIPPMMLQTLTENAIKHGVSNLVKGGLIQISTEIANSVLTIKIRNSGKLLNGANRPKSRTGVGLVNTKERLKLIYGERATFRMYNENDTFVVAEVKIPQRI